LPERRGELDEKQRSIASPTNLHYSLTIAVLAQCA
jgi:hypothetical protein